MIVTYNVTGYNTFNAVPDPLIPVLYSREKNRPIHPLWRSEP
jgi:hypothetical protein